MPSYQRALRGFLVSLVAGVALVCVFTAAGQSGRRTKKTTPAAPIPAAKPDPTPVKTAEKPKPAVSLIVGMEHYNGFDVYVRNPASVLMAVCDRLNDNSAVKVEQIGRDMDRGDAIRRAKSEKEAYVVLIELEAESRTAGSQRVDEVSVQYSVFSPSTAKVKAFGRTYPQTARRGGVILNPGRQDIFGDYQLQQAGKHAAEKILDAFHLSFASTGTVASQD